MKRGALRCVLSLTSVHTDRGLVQGGSHDRSDIGLAVSGHPPVGQRVKDQTLGSTAVENQQSFQNRPISSHWC